MSRLVHVNLSGNAFTGELPPSLAAPKFMRKLEVQDNGFCGEIPEWLIRRDHLELLDFTRNSFTGVLPSAFYSASTKSIPTLPGYGNRPAGCHRGLNSDGIRSFVRFRIGRES
ncbi:Leucine-rich repeat [Ostreococcus tauri]|uniref:Leucine-rich repeat n=1 Tax=Ostreococcus tauri TaxID=70448 RepID=A0A096PBE1_OSTTA|nr:Leucine-rich repeat [Ostreococcus tauri]CEG01921.1 Leucine-rich repeat [Ostreococcus tauri]|eukprot:XP_022841251.1 Leucine-rich repeat [Ostreococcus tauri]